MPPDFDRKTEDASCCRKIWAASADTSLLIHEFLTKHETTVVSQLPYSPDCPCRLFLVPEVEILTKGRRRGDRRKFDMGPWYRPAKHIPGRVPEMEKTLGAVH